MPTCQKQSSSHVFKHHLHHQQAACWPGALNVLCHARCFGEGFCSVFSEFGKGLTLKSKINEMNICVVQSKTLPKQLKLYWVSLESTELNTIELWIFTTSWSHVHWTIPGSKQPSLLNRWTVPTPWGGFPQLKRFGSPNVPPRMLDIHMSTHNDVSMHFICKSGTSWCTTQVVEISLFFVDFSAQSFTGHAPF